MTHSMTAALRVWESRLVLYRRIWRSNVLGSFVQPMLYLTGMGVGVGSLVDHGSGASSALDHLSYITFLAPALLATTAMFASANEALWPVMDGFMWSEGFRSMAATPLSPTDIVNGTVLWQATRAGIAATGVAIALACFHSTRSWGLVPAIPSAVLTGLAFAMPITAWSSTRHVDQSFPAIMRFVITPMFLFAGAFYPIDRLPGWLHPVAYVTPLWHGVELCRGLSLHTIGGAAVVVHAVVLAVFALAGWSVCRITFARRLAQ
jgi:lipooligosaccharide transport system permease protein